MIVFYRNPGLVMSAFLFSHKTMHNLRWTRHFWLHRSSQITRSSHGYNALHFTTLFYIFSWFWLCPSERLAPRPATKPGYLQLPRLGRFHQHHQSWAARCPNWARVRPNWTLFKWVWPQYSILITTSNNRAESCLSYQVDFYISKRRRFVTHF